MRNITWIRLVLIISLKNCSGMAKGTDIIIKRDDRRNIVQAPFKLF